MDHNMALILSILNLIVVLLILLLLLLAASAVEESRTKHKSSHDGPDGRTSSNKFQQQEEKAAIEKLAEGIARLEQQLRPMLDLTIKHERRLSGIQSKGALGEQIVGEKLGDLPHDWYDRKVPFPNGAKADFALRTPDKRWIPIDSQWTATELLDRIEQAKDQIERNSFRLQIHQEVRNHAKAAQKYLDRDSTLGFCIVAVPSSVFELCIDMQAELVSDGIVLISYSLLVPYILLIFDLFLKNAQSTQTLEISYILGRSASQIELIQKYINMKVRPPLDSVKLQQTNYGLHSQRLHDLHSRLSEIQGELDSVRNMVNPLSNADIGSIPNILHTSLTKVRDDLLEGLSRQNGQRPDSEDK
jgi:DNA anti-recombination protein RmuC